MSPPGRSYDFLFYVLSLDDAVSEQNRPRCFTKFRANLIGLGLITASSTTSSDHSFHAQEPIVRRWRLAQTVVETEKVSIQHFAPTAL